MASRPPYSTARWQKRAKHQLKTEPVCVLCWKEQGRVMPATVADHIDPHRGDLTKFWFGQLQSLCAYHHNSVKAQRETRGYSTEIGDDGWPIDPFHPINRPRNQGGRGRSLSNRMVLRKLKGAGGD
jgi:5-methylcytosine-specific restriction protein A